MRLNTIKFAGAGTLFLVVFLAQGVFFIWTNSPTYDEGIHIAAGYSYLAKRDFRLDPEHPPLIKELEALPLFIIYRPAFNPNPQQWRGADGYIIGQDFLYRSTLSADRILAVSRFPNLLLGGVLVLAVGWWAYSLWGSRAAILAMALTSLEPNLVAHSSLITTDLGVALFMFLALYFLWEYLNQPKWWVLVLTGICTGLALVSKFSALLLIPIIALIITLSFLINTCTLLPLERNKNEPRHKFFQAAAVFFVILSFAVVTIPPAYLFQDFTPWVSGLEQFMSLAHAGRLAFFLGESSYLGWWNYFIVSFLIKTPIGSLILIAASLACYRVGTRLGGREAILLLVPVVFIFVATSQAKVNIGLRHLLPVYPLLFVLASRLATVRFHRAWLAPVIIGIPVVLTAISSLRVAPHQLAYFNELAGGPEEGYRYLSDSNLDWGQDLEGLKAYIDKNNLPMIYLSYFGTAPPSYYGIRYQYVPGAWPLEWPPPADRVPATASRKILAISVYNLQDVSTAYYPLFRWLWTRNPIAKIGYSIFVYDLTEDREGLAKLEESYAKAGIILPP